MATTDDRRGIEKPNRGIERGWGQVHVPLCRSQIGVSSQLLNCPRWRPTHRQMRTERVAKNVNPAMVQLRRLRRMVNVVSDDLFVQWLPLSIAKHERATKMSRRV